MAREVTSVILSISFRLKIKDGLPNFGDVHSRSKALHRLDRQRVVATDKQA